jgi:hypothetical protein
MATWHEITRDPEYQELSEQGKALVKQGFFEREISSDPEFKAFSPQTQKAVFDDFWQTPDDSGQGIVTSTLGSAARGFGEIVPGTLEGVGALTGITPISDLGESAREGLEYIAPVNPIYEQGIPAKVANVAGNVASIIGTSGVGGLAGKALGAERAAAAGSAAARQALTNQAIQAGAKSALYGTGFAQGAAAKAAENERLGITGAEGYLNLLGGGISELAPEMLPFGSALETSAARRLLGGVDDAAGRVIPGIRMSAAQEAAEGGSTQVLSNLSTQLTAPTGVEAPGLFEGAGEAALWEGVGGAMFGAINKLGRTPPERQTDIQKAFVAEDNVDAVDKVPDQTDDEKLVNMNAGGTTVVDPQGKTAVIAPPAPKTPSQVIAENLATAAENTSNDASKAVAAARAVTQQVTTTNEPITQEALPPEPEIRQDMQESRQLPLVPEQPLAQEPQAPVELPVPTVEPTVETPIQNPAEIHRNRNAESESYIVRDAEGFADRKATREVVEVAAKAAGMTVDEWAADQAAKNIKANKDFFDALNDGDTLEWIDNNGRKGTGRVEIGLDGEKTVRNTTEGSPSEDYQYTNRSGIFAQVADSLKITPKRKEAAPATEAPAPTAETLGVTAPPAPTLETPEGAARNADMLRQAQARLAGTEQGPRIGFLQPSEVAPATEAPPITPTKETPTPATEGTVMPGGSAMERDVTKPEQMTPEEHLNAWNQLNIDAQKAREKANAAKAKLLPKNPASQIRQMEKNAKLEQEAITLENLRDEFPPTPSFAIENAVKEGKPFSVDLHKASGYAYIPSGYTRQGDLYVFQPGVTGELVQVAPSAAQAVTKPATVKSTELRVGDEVSFKGNTYRVKSKLLDGRVRAEFTNPEGIAKLPAGSVNITTLPRNVNLTRIEKPSPQTTTVATPTETAAPLAKEAAVASVVQQPAEGSIPAVEQESAITPIESNEKADIADAAMAFLEEDLTESKRQWSPEKIAAAKAYFASGGKDMDVLRAAFPKLVGSRPIVQAYLKADKEASEAQAKRDAADAKLAKEIERDEKEQAKAEEAQRKREELNIKTLNSLIQKTRTNVVQGTVKPTDANQAVAILNSSGEIPNVLFTWIGTSKDFLADPANRVRYPETWKAISSNPNIEGASDNGQPIVFTDNIGVSDLDRKLANLQGTTPEVAAVRRVILHENIHKGIFFLSKKEKMQIFSLLRRMYSPEELDSLAKSYSKYSDWRTNRDNYFSLLEEAMIRDFDSMAEIPRDGIWAEFMQFLRGIWQKITGKTSEPTLKDYKDVFRLIRNSLKNSEKANADMLVNGGGVRIGIASKVEYDSPNDAAFNSGAEVARNTDYDERDKEVRSTIRAAYDIAPKTNGPSVPLDELFSIVQQSMPDLTETEFSRILQGLYEDSGALLIEGEVAPSYTSEEEARHAELEAKFNAGTITPEDTAEAQALVDERAKAAGYDGGIVWHGDRNEEFVDNYSPFTEPKIPFFTTPSKKSASWYGNPRSYYSKKSKVAGISDIFNAANALGITKDKSDPYYEFWPEIKKYSEYDGVNDNDLVYVPSIREELVKRGFTRVRVLDQLENQEITADIFIDSPSQIKSADPFTGVPLNQRFDTGNDIRGNINTFTTEGERAGSVIVMPPSGFQTRAMASMIDPKDAATKQFAKNIKDINSGTAKAAFDGVQFVDFEPVDHIVKPNKSYEKIAIDYVDGLLGEGKSIEDIATSIMTPMFFDSIGISNDVKARQALTSEVLRRVTDLNGLSNTRLASKRLQKLEDLISAFWQGLGTESGGNQGQRAFIIGSPRYSWMFLKDSVKKEMKERRNNILTVQFGNNNATSFTQNSYENADKASTMSADEIASDIEDFKIDQDLLDGEATLTGKLAKMYEELKDLLRENGILARLDAQENITAKASISPARREELAALSKDERAKLRDKNNKRIEQILNTLLGKEEDADTTEKKTVRKKREKMVDAVKKRVEQGKPIEPTDYVPIITENPQRDEIIDDVSNALLQAAKKRGVKPSQKTALADLVASIKSLLKRNIKGEDLKADEAPLGQLLARTYLDNLTATEAKLFTESWNDGRKKVRAMLTEMGVEGTQLEAELNAIMPATPTIAYNPSAVRKAITRALREAGLDANDLLANTQSVKSEILKVWDNAAVDAGLTPSVWQEGRKLAEKSIDEFVIERKASKEKAKKIAKVVSEQANNPVSLADFSNSLSQYKLNDGKVKELFDKAKVLANKKVQIAYDMAVRVLLVSENNLAQSAFFNSATKPDTIVKAFRQQVSDPMSRQDFKDRMEAMKVSGELADRLFDRAAREKDNAQWKRAQDMLEGPNALRNILREINRARPGNQAPLSEQIPWRQLLSQSSKTVEEYRQRILDAISANESLKNATPEQKARLAELFTEAWETKRKRILDSMQERLIREQEAKGNLSKKAAKALQENRMRIVEDINLGIFDNDEIAKIIAEKFGIKSEFTDEERQKIESLIAILQDEKLNRVKRNKAAYELLETLSAQTGISIAKLLANFWVSSVLSGMNTVFSIGMSVFSGMGELTTALSRIFSAAFSNPKQLSSEVAAAFKTLARVISAVPRQANRAWQYLVTGDQAFLDPSMNDALKNMDYASIGKNNQLAEQMAKSDKILEKSMGLFMRTVSRLLTALDLFNSGLTKEGSLSIVFRQLDLDPVKIQMLEKKSDLKAYKDQVIRDYFNNVQPKTLNEKALVESYAMAEMMKALDEIGNVSENADQMAMQGAMTLDPSGLGGYGYRFVKSMMKSAESGTDKLLERNLRKWDEAVGVDEKAEAGVKLVLSYIFQFAAYNAANLVGVRFARFAGNKFNQSLSFLPLIGALRLYEAEFDSDRIRGKEAFTDMIKRNQLTGVIAAVIGYYVLKAIAEEPDDEKRGAFINGGWSNLTPEKKQQKIASGQKEYTLGFGDTVINYGNWPGSGILAAIGGLSDLIRFSPDQWNDKTVANKLLSATTSGVFSAMEVPALSQFQELFGSSLSSKDPNEQKLTKFARVIGNYVGGFVPRILKDIDYISDPNFRKYETLWEKTASHIPVYRRYEGKEYYDILGQQIQRNVYPGSREFMVKPTDPAYKVLGALNSRGIWLTPANAEHRMVGKGARRRSLTQEEADNYSLETGKGYKQMLLRYGQRALQMPTERAKAFLLDKADEVRDRALKKVYRGYQPAT